jgi:hypothetical protein
MKYTVVLLAALVLVLAAQALGRADAPAGVQRWEYKVWEPPKDAAEQALNALAAEGWEWVGTSMAMHRARDVLRRPAK